MATTPPKANDVTAPGGPDDPVRVAPWVVTRAVSETHDTSTVALRPVTSDGPFSFLPGQFNMLYAFGVGEVPISISGSPADARQVVHTVRAVGSVTQVLRRLKKGDVVGLRGPYGTAWPVDLAVGHDLVIVAGGIGLAPLRPALYHVLAHRSQYGNVVLLYGARTPEDLLFARELESWRKRFDIEVNVTVDRAGPGWHGHVGVVTTLLPEAPFQPENAMAFVCGPEIMMVYAARDLERRGVAAARIWLSMERNMKCGVALCGHCQLGPTFVCKDGPVFRYDTMTPLLAVREL